ncbi:hypothetical protein QJS66_21585 [Kocuria rhizophila]|nr:hypothetical protein QJS66_21585 [Kocuria rhizophila]
MLLGAGHPLQEVARALDSPASMPPRRTGRPGPGWPTVLVDFARAPTPPPVRVRARAPGPGGRPRRSRPAAAGPGTSKRELTGQAVVESRRGHRRGHGRQPRSEDSAAIRAAVMRGVDAAVRRRAAGRPVPDVVEAPTRRDAIRTALELTARRTPSPVREGPRALDGDRPAGARVPFVDSDEVRAAASRPPSSVAGQAGPPRGGAAAGERGPGRRVV